MAKLKQKNLKKEIVDIMKRGTLYAYGNPNFYIQNVSKKIVELVERDYIKREEKNE